MSLKTPIYLDYNATTPVDPRVLEAMLPYLKEDFGNAASRSHGFGWRASDAVDIAREQVAKIIGAGPKDIVFTSGATESDNIALIGVMEKYSSKGNHLITAATEHKAVIDTAKYLETKGYKVTILPVDKYGQVHPDQVDEAITPETVLVSIMLANNETGVLHPVKEIGQVVEKHGIFFHCDATQAIGKVPIDVNDMGIHLLSLSGHKIYGPKGIGVLYARSRRPRVRPTTLVHGGGHEQGMRSGTLNVPGIVGLGKACELCLNGMDVEIPRIKDMRDKLDKEIFKNLDEVYINGHPTERLPTTTNLSFNYVEGESIMMTMKDVAVSSGSACTSASLAPSYVLAAMGVPEGLAHASLRFSLGRFTIEAEIDYVIEKVIKAIHRLREMSPLFEMAQKGIDIDSLEWTHEHQH